jgi:hypothetical protein
MRRWLLAFFLVAAGGAFYLGWLVFQPASSERDQQLGLTDEQRQRIEQLEAIGYLPGVEPAEEEAHGVVQHDPARTFSGPMLYASGHAPEAGLIDTDGTELHRWNFPARDAWPGYPLVHQARAQLFRRAYVYPNGDLLVIFEGIGLVRIDKNSKRVWALLNRAHHAADILADGTIFALTRRAAVVPAVDPERPVLEDFIVELGPDGSRRRQVSILRALLNSEYRPMATVADPRLPPQGMVQFENGDLHHTNSIQILLRDHPTIPKLRRSEWSGSTRGTSWHSTMPASSATGTFCCSTTRRGTGGLACWPASSATGTFCCSTTRRGTGGLACWRSTRRPRRWYGSILRQAPATASTVIAAARSRACPTAIPRS